MTFEEHRSQMPNWAARKGADALLEYQWEKNRVSLDGLPALQWTESTEEKD